MWSRRLGEGRAFSQSAECGICKEFRRALSRSVRSGDATRLARSAESIWCESVFWLRFLRSNSEIEVDMMELIHVTTGVILGWKGLGSMIEDASEAV